MQHPQESTAESKTKGGTAFGAKYQGGVVELKFFHRRPQVLIVLCIYGINPGKYHRFHILKPGNRLFGWVGGIGNRIPHLNLFGLFDSGDQVAHVSSRNARLGHLSQFQCPHFIGKIILVGVDKLDFLTLFNGSIDHAEVGFHPAKRIVHGVKNKGLQRLCGIAFRCWDALDNRA